MQCCLCKGANLKVLGLTVCVRRPSATLGTLASYRQYVISSNSASCHAGHQDSLVSDNGAGKLDKGSSRHQTSQLSEVQGAPRLVALVGVQPLRLLPEQRPANGTPPEGWHH